MSTFAENLGRIPIQPETPPTQEDFNKGEIQTALLSYSLETAKVGRFIANTSLRTKMSYWASFTISIWLIIVALILMYNNDKFCLSDSVIITLITTTTINVIGIILICFRDLFNGKSEITIK
jgi:hypothetical protein